MKAMEYMLEGLDKSISYDELGNVYVEKSNLKWYDEERLSGMGVRWHCGDDYIFISKEDCAKYNEYEIIIPDGLDYDGNVRRPYYRMRGKPVTKEQAFELIRRTDNFFAEIDEIRCSGEFVGCDFFSNHLIHKNHYPRTYGWVHADGTIGTNNITSKYPELYNFVVEWCEKLFKFPYLDLVIGITCWNEMPNALWKDLDNKAKYREMELNDKLFFSGVVLGIYIHDKTLEVLPPRKAIRKYKEYAKRYEKNKEVYIPEYYQENGIVQVDLPYARRCIEAYGLNADEILKDLYWHFEKK